MPDQPIDPERPRHANAFDQPDGYSGQDYTIARETAVGQPPVAAGAVVPDGRGLPPDAGHRASADPVTGEVHGSGSGTGGGNEGEDFDSSTASGDSYPVTGGEGTDHAPADLGPSNLNE